MSAWRIRWFYVSSLALLSLLLVPALGAEPEKPQPGDAMIERYLQKETARLSERFLDGAKTRAEWEARKPRLRREYFDMLGLWPLPEKTPLHATITGAMERGEVVIEKLHFQSRPGLYVTGNLYRPKAARSHAERGNEKDEKVKLPAILYVCGHAFQGRDGNKSAHQDHGMWFASNGYVCLILDSLQLGEIPGIHHGTYGTPYRHFGSYGLKGQNIVENRWWWQARGYTPAGVECWNGIRALDYLVSRPEVDAERIGVTGISGGGAATFWISAADERVKVAVPVSGMSDLESYVSHKVINGHCDCMFLINTYQWEWTTIATLIAPRPLLFANSDNDSIFPMDGNRRIIARLRQLYKMYDKPELVADYISKGGHAYRPDLRIAVFKWMNKHLKNDTSEVKDADFPPLPGKELRVFPEEKDIPKDALNGKIDETFVPLAQVKLPEAKEFSRWQADMVEKLRTRSFRALPKRIPKASGGDGLYVSDHRTENGKESWERRAFTMGTEEGISVTFESFLYKQKAGGSKDGVIIVLSEDDAGCEEIPAWAKPLVAESEIRLLMPRGIIIHKWTHKSPPNYVERAHALLGRTVDEGRVWDIAALARFVAENPESKKVKWKVAGRGRTGILAAYAALFEPSIQEAVIVDPPVSHREGPIFLNVLRVLDIPEALGLLAPRRLTLINAKDKAFDRTAEIYRLAGAADRLQRK